MTLDWEKPIKLRNGERVELIETCLEGFRMFPETTRMIRRLDVDTSTMGGAMSSIWYTSEDGKSNWPDGQFDVINCDND